MSILYRSSANDLSAGAYVCGQDHDRGEQHCFNYQGLRSKEDGLNMPGNISVAFSLNREWSQFGGHIIYRFWTRKKIGCSCQCPSHAGIGDLFQQKSLSAIFDLYYFIWFVLVLQFHLCLIYKLLLFLQLSKDICIVYFRKVIVRTI